MSPITVKKNALFAEFPGGESSYRPVGRKMTTNPNGIFPSRNTTNFLGGKGKSNLA